MRKTIFERNKLENGILWFDDNTKKTLIERYATGAVYYFDKYHAVPNICFVHPSMLEGQTIPEYIEILPNKNLMSGYLWIGMKPGTEAYSG